jgi:hypothetical protein
MYIYINIKFNQFRNFPELMQVRIHAWVHNMLKITILIKVLYKRCFENCYILLFELMNKNKVLFLLNNKVVLFSSYCINLSYNYLLHKHVLLKRYYSGYIFPLFYLKSIVHVFFVYLLLYIYFFGFRCLNTLSVFCPCKISGSLNVCTNCLSNWSGWNIII